MKQCICPVCGQPFTPGQNVEIVPGSSNVGQEKLAFHPECADAVWGPLERGKYGRPLGT